MPTLQHDVMRLQYCATSIRHCSHAIRGISRDGDLDGLAHRPLNRHQSIRLRRTNTSPYSSSSLARSWAHSPYGIRAGTIKSSLPLFLLPVDRICCMGRRWFSVNINEDILSKSSRSVPVLRSLVKPFLLKCHPDVHVSTEAKTINLSAIQNLNSYLDTLQSIESADKFALSALRRNADDSVVEIDFVLLLEARPRMKKNEKKLLSLNSSRRKVELLLPPYRLCQAMADASNQTSSRDSSFSTRGPPHPPTEYIRQRFYEHARGELLKLMAVAGLNSNASHMKLNMENGSASSNFQWDAILDDSLDETDSASRSQGYEGRHTNTASSSRTSAGFQRSHNPFRAKSRPLVQKPRQAQQSPYERSRARFTANIQWHNYDQLYAQAVAEMNADAATEGLVERNPVRRRNMIASILANVRIATGTATTEPSTSHSAVHKEAATTNDEDGSCSISFVEQLVAFRRLSLLLDENFAALQMEEFGAMWETCRIVLTPSRPYNVSSSALYKQRHKSQTANLHQSQSLTPLSVSGFCFTLHPDWTVTIHIPVDFRDDELINELDRNVWDFYNLLGDGTEALFPDQYEVNRQMA